MTETPPRPPSPPPPPPPEPPEVQAPQRVPVEQLRFAMPPEHGSPEDERVSRRERLAAALRLFGRFGYEDGVSGHITARDPEFADCFWINPFGVPFAQITAGELLLVNSAGQVVDGCRRVNQAAFAVHAAVHLARPDVIAVAHTHSVHGRALAALGELIDPITQEACAFYEDHALVDSYTGVAVDQAEGRRIAAALGGRKAVILRNHGLLTVGDSVDAAAWWFISMERCCRIQLLARAAGKPVLIGARDAAATRERLGSDLVAWISYQPLWRQISREEPDLLRPHSV
ncbi:class II aldolase/adducin family protein [Streptomyces sp. HNM0663]|uniref:Class II aldolase/adducin family protein n=1 Tax=Streptomyces chengmaiensis TaxID=3040919 RepID=A0ABT6HLK6_9ACTN|nr:class II aldolase/adducin family protein [Streptomyces chengmaiensis]MDH2389495.1 class II aldolase/adducin family protein [Streptomyces chengmaiensis]